MTMETISRRRRHKDFRETVRELSRHSIFGAIKDAVFGSKPKSETTSETVLSPEQEEAQKVLSEFLQTGGNPATAKPFEGELIAPLSNVENLSLAALEERARSLATQTDPALQAASEALIGILQRGPTDITEFVNRSIRDPLREEFERTRAATAGRFADSFFGSDRKERDARDFEEFMEALAASTSGAALDARNADTDAILRAAGIAPQLASAQSNELINLLQAGSVPRGVETDTLQAEFERFREFTSRQQQMSQIINQFLGVPTTENIVTTTPGTEGLLGAGLKAGAKVLGAKAGGAIGAGIF